MSRDINEWRDRFNDRFPVGTPVIVKLNGKVMETSVRTPAALLPHPTPMVQLEGVDGWVPIWKVDKE